MTETVLAVSGLGVAFRDRRGGWRPVVEDVAFEIGQTETVALVGESGSGKSVSALAVMRLLDPATTRIEGRVLLAGQDLLPLSESAMRGIRGDRIAMIFQEPMTSLNPALKIGDQLSEVLVTHRGMGRRKALKESERLLDRVRIPAARQRLEEYPHQSSGGMRQRFMIAMALACRPNLLIADEPTTALDVTIQAQILELLLSLQSELGMALILITHDMAVVSETAQRVMVQYAGQQVERRDVAGLFSAPAHPYTSALLAALPERARGRRLPSIPGVVPGQGDRPSGCLFNPRCGFATERCRNEAPTRQASNGGDALCHYPILDGRPSGHPGPLPTAAEASP